MEIGARLKEARLGAGLTQEQAAEALGVSRQTVSNWENEKTYPDIVSVIRLSDLYGVSLDRLLKGEPADSGYLEYLGESTDTVRSRRRLSVLILLLSYLGIWAAAVIAFWFFSSGSDAMGYSLVFLWVLLPVAGFAVSFLLGHQGLGARQTAGVILGAGILYMLAEFCTFGATNMAAFRHWTMPDFGMIPAGALISAAGFFLAFLLRRRKSAGRQR